MRTNTNVGIGLGLLIFSLAPAHGAAVLTTAFGDLATVTAARDTFRTALGGGTVAGLNGLFGGIRREINWDGVPEGSSSPNDFPADFFNTTSPRGVVYSTPGTGFQVSSSGAAGLQFVNLNATYPATFEPFSGAKLFTSVGSNISDTNFFLPGTNTPAFTNAFGVVFSDVDLANTTSVQFFDTSNNSLGTFFAPAGSGNETFSFLGVQFNAVAPAAFAPISSFLVTNSNPSWAIAIGYVSIALLAIMGAIAAGYALRTGGRPEVPEQASEK